MLDIKAVVRLSTRDKILRAVQCHKISVLHFLEENNVQRENLNIRMKMVTAGL